MRSALRRAVVLGSLCAVAIPAIAQAAIQTIDGSPLNVYMSDDGNMQARFDNASQGSTDGFFFSGDDGSSGFFLRFADGTTYGSRNYEAFTVESQGPVTGDGSTTAPFTLETSYLVRQGETNIARVRQTTRYVNGQTRFRQTYRVENLTSEALRFRASTGGDLYVDGDDSGVGILIDSSPRFVGGTNTNSRITGGVEEVLSSRLASDAAPVPVAPWSAYEVNGYSTVYSLFGSSGGLTNFIVGTQVDNGAGVQWSDHLAQDAGLAPGATARYEALWKVRQPVPLTVTPAHDTPEVGSVHRVIATLRDSADQPLNGVRLRWSAAGVHSASGDGMSEGSGQVLIEWTGTATGIDTLTVYPDYNDNGQRDADEAAATAKAHWRPESDVDPPVVTAPATPGGGTLRVSTQTDPARPNQREYTVANSQIAQFPACADGSRRVELPISVNVTPAAGSVLNDDVDLLVVDRTSRDVTAPIATYDQTGPSQSGVYSSSSTACARASCTCAGR